MNIVLFYHSLLSDWNHGNAHFLRGIATELIKRGNSVKIYEPKNNWSISNLIADNGKDVLAEFHDYYPQLTSTAYDLNSIDLNKILNDADLVIVHEWNEHALVKMIGETKKKFGFKLLFHDTHHRAITERSSMSNYDLSNYDGVLVFGECIRKIYLKHRWAKRAWTWHEAADVRIFKPLKRKKTGDLIWVGNWGDEERTKELFEFLIEPVEELKLKAKIFGVRYPEHAKRALKEAGIKYAGWLPNYKAPEVFASHRLTVHVPRRPYVEALPGIPTIRPFEALACGIPLISAPWNDVEHLFTPGKDFIVANNKAEMKKWMKKILNDEEFATQLAQHGLQTIRSKHTCAHRVDELYNICDELGVKNLEQNKIIAQ